MSRNKLVVVGASLAGLRAVEAARKTGFEGEITLGDVILFSGDGAGLTGERAVSLTAREETEILLLDLGAERPRS